MIAARLRAQGVPDSAITIIPDEQEAIDHGLRMGRQGDLLLIFADALVRSWKQVIYFRPEGAAAPKVAATAAQPVDAPVTEEQFTLGEGMVRDERGIRMVRDAED